MSSRANSLKHIVLQLNARYKRFLILTSHSHKIFFSALASFFFPSRSQWGQSVCGSMWPPREKRAAPSIFFFSENTAFYCALVVENLSTFSEKDGSLQSLFIRQQIVWLPDKEQLQGASFFWKRWEIFNYKCTKKAGTRNHQTRKDLSPH